MSAGVFDRSRQIRLAPALGAERRLTAPDPEVPHWREADGTRRSYGSLRSGLEPRHAAELADAHLRGIGRIVPAALAAPQRDDYAETARLAAAAARLCGEIRRPLVCQRGRDPRATLA